MAWLIDGIRGSPPAKVRNLQSRLKIHFLLENGQSGIYSTRIAVFNAGRMNLRQACQGRIFQSQFPRAASRNQMGLELRIGH